MNHSSAVIEPQPLERFWHARTTHAVLSDLDAQETGLSTVDADARLRYYGPNRLPEPAATPLHQIVLRQFLSPLVYVLVIAAAVSALIGEYQDATFIAVVLFINSAIGTVQEWRAEGASQALRKMLTYETRVFRDGRVQQMPAENLVPGDVVVLESGSRVPADLRLLLSQELEIDESMLTGESIAVHKDAVWQGLDDTILADRINMAFAGSMVMRGRGQGVVVATGSKTCVGQIAQDLIVVPEGIPPLIQRMERFTKFIAIGTILASVLIGALAILTLHQSIQETFFLTVALAVSAIPEGLPIAITVALSVASSRMAKRNVIVRHLAAVEGLGSCTMIATDKTGTLTRNEMTVRELVLPDLAQATVTGEGFTPNGSVRLTGQLTDQSSELLNELVLAGVLCNESDLRAENGDWHFQGDAVDISFLTLGHKLGLDRTVALEDLPQISQLPFESENQYSASFHRCPSGTTAFVKGAPERVLSMCDGGTIARDKWNDRASQMAREGLRVIALAKKYWPKDLKADDDRPRLEGLKFLGLAGLMDPLRAGVRDAIDRCRTTGVNVAMITGDHRDTATTIGRDLGLIEHEKQAINGHDLSRHTEDELDSQVSATRVFSRVTPRQKLEIVQAMRRAGHFVAVTGDGVNDAPALRAANIGVAMGRSGTDVAREAAQLVITDDNFASIVGGIEEGRIAYDNIRKVIFLLTSMGVAELIMVLLAVLTGTPLPLLPVQLLWLNLVTDGIQGVALAFEPGEGNLMNRKPRAPNEPIFDRLMIERMLIAVSTVSVGAFLTYYCALRSGMAVADARNLTLLVMVLFENFHVGNCRSETQTVFRMSPLQSPLLLIGTLAALGVHILGMHLPLLQSVLATRPVGIQMWGIATLVACSVLVAMELHKLLWKRRFPQSAL